MRDFIKLLNSNLMLKSPENIMVSGSKLVTIIPVRTYWQPPSLFWSGSVISESENKFSPKRGPLSRRGIEIPNFF